jgi:hypothetical protein
MEKYAFLLFCHPLKLYKILYSTGTVFFTALLSLEDYAKTSELSYKREREREKNYTVNVQCSVQYTLLLLYLMLVITLFKVGNVLLCITYQLNFTVFMYVT